MRLLISLGILALAALVGCSPGGSSNKETSSTQAVSTPGDKAAAAPAQPTRLCVIDVRTDEEWAEEHVAGALHLPLDQFREKIAAVVPDKQTSIGVYCASGMRSGSAARILKELGYTRVENLGGLDDAKQKVSPSRGTP
jgi:phage shock protein E